ncbi:MAG: DUF4382 domain-containing protein [Taibaiella sp.]|nr:DUF4382 domain-containing protein [Taibaiella sp.]
MMMRKSLSIFAVLLAISSLFACKKSSTPDNNTAQMSMRLTDDPANYDAVYVDIQKIGFTMEGQSEIMLTPNRPGVYNLLSFRNGLDTLLVNAAIPVGTIGQIRLVLGNNNSVVVSGVSYPLSTPSAQESGLKLNFQTAIAANVAYTIWMDFDAGKSIIQTGGGNYKLKPVIRAYSALTNGEISGSVLPTLAFATVYAINGTDTAAAIPSSTDGHFVINGLASGSYQLVVSPAVTTYLSYSTSVNVAYGVITNVGTITLHP